MQPKWVVPMLATLTKHAFSDPAWIFERKLDGMRCLLHKDDHKVTIWSRNKIQQNAVFPELVAALAKYRSNFILDCEVVTFAGNKTSFEKLANRMHVRNPEPKLIKQFPVIAYVFDILYLNGYNLTKLPLIARKKVLQQNFKFSKPFKYLTHRKTTGENYLAYACKHGWEGLIAKQANSSYVSKRSKNWLKFKCDSSQELVIGGYTHPQGSRVKFGALLVGYYKNNVFKYAGRVGTGFNADTLLSLHKKMRPLEIKHSPFSDFNPNSKSTVWLKPKLVAELGFTEWTIPVVLEDAKIYL